MPLQKKTETQSRTRFVISSEWMGQVSNGRVSLQMNPDPQRLTLARPDPLHAVKTSPFTGTSTSVVNMQLSLKCKQGILSCSDYRIP